VEVVWHNYAHPTYLQQHGEFLPYLSVIDLLLNEGGNSLAILSR
jgi:WbqC-like protein family